MARGMEYKGKGNLPQLLENGLKLANGTQITSHTATPEAAITAPVGSLCVDTTAGTLYVKNTGSSNTGWTLLDTSTGHDQAAEISVVDTSIGSGETQLQGLADYMMVAGFFTAETAKGLKVATIQVVTDQQGAISDSAVQDITGSDTIDKTKLTADLLSVSNAVDSVLAALRTHGLIAT